MYRLLTLWHPCVHFDFTLPGPLTMFIQYRMGLDFLSCPVLQWVAVEFKVNP